MFDLLPWQATVISGEVSVPLCNLCRSRLYGIWPCSDANNENDGRQDVFSDISGCLLSGSELLRYAPYPLQFNSRIRTDGCIAL